MREFEQKRKVRRILSSPLILIPLAVVFFFVARGTWNIYRKDRAAVGELGVSEERVLKLENRQAMLSAAIQKLSTESGVESEIRDRFHMAKEGEREIVIVDAAPTVNPTTPISKGLIQRIIDFFTKR